MVEWFIATWPDIVVGGWSRGWRGGHFRSQPEIGPLPRHISLLLYIYLEIFISHPQTFLPYNIEILHQYSKMFYIGSFMYWLLYVDISLAAWDLNIWATLQNYLLLIPPS